MRASPKARRVFPTAAVLLLLLTPTACQPAPQPPHTPVKLVIGASDSAVLVVRDLAEAYHQAHTYATLQIETGNSSTVLEGFSHGRFNLVIISRNPRADELSGAHARAVEIGRDGIVLIVHPANLLTGVSLDELARIFSGDIIDWSELHRQVATKKAEPIQVVSRESGSGTRAVFERIVMPGRRVTPTALVKPGEREVEAYVSGDVNAIGYMAFNVWQESARTHALSIDKIVPSLQTIHDFSYPLMSTLYLALPDPAEPDLQDFSSFVASEAGKTLISKRVAVTR